MARAQQIPGEMRAAVMDRFGPPNVIHTAVLPTPKLGKKDVLVRVSTAGVGEWDPSIVDGSFSDVGAARFPRILGSDGSGTIVAVGESVDRYEVGDRVYGWGFGNAKGGFFAEYAALKERNVAPVPASLSLDEAGGLAAGGLTALHGLEQLDLDEGASIVIFGASGAVGHLAVQLAKAIGLRVFAIASKADGVDLVEKLGADEVAEGHRKTLVADLREFAPDGFDGALVFAGAKGWSKELAVLKKKGARVAWPNGVEPTPKVRRGVKKISYDADESPRAFARLNDLVERGAVHVEISKSYPLDETAKALKDVQRHHVGKLAIDVRH